jgi:methionyl-tRNA synthetase
MTTPKRILVTAALPYANGPIHLGHLAGAYLPADLYVRYQRLRGREVVFICGSDEHGVPITLTADREGITPQAVVDRYHTMNKAAFEAFGMSFDNYSRTSLPLHHTTAQEFFLEFHRRGILKEKAEQQFYDEQARMFLPDRYVEGTCPVCANPEARGDQCEKCGSYLSPLELKNPRSKITGQVPVVRETTHLYFPLGMFQERLQEYVRRADGQDGWKENVLRYCGSWFRDGLQDRAVTRDLDWGVRVPLPGYERKVMYVWFDAVLGYISSTREWAQARGTPEAWRPFWTDPSTKYVAFIGKDNVVFHCIVFPAMLMAWNDGAGDQYVLPANVPANEFLNFEGQKFSKSRGWGIDVADFLARYPADTLRYYLAMSLPENRDSDFYWKEYQARTNNELADIFGNFVNRTLAFVQRTFDGVVPPLHTPAEADRAMLTAVKTAAEGAAGHFEHYRFREAVVEVMNLARAANKYFNDAEPWKTAKTDRERCETTLHVCVQLVRSLAILMSPATPFSTVRILQMLNLPGTGKELTWDGAVEPAVPAGHRIGTPQILFTKIEDAMMEKETSSLGVPPTPPSAPPVAAAAPPGVAPAASPASVPAPAVKEPVTIGDFQKLDLRVAKVVECDRVPKSEKLLRLQVEIGGERRQVVAGIAQHYAPEELIGKLVVVVYNLVPAKLMGQESKGMVLAASDPSGKLVVVTPSAEIATGGVVK